MSGLLSRCQAAELFGVSVDVCDRQWKKYLCPVKVGGAVRFHSKLVEMAAAAGLEQLKRWYKEHRWCTEKAGAPQGQVYFIQCDMTHYESTPGPIKIGYAVDARKRIDNIRCSCPFPVFIVAILVNGSPALEHSLHDRFKRHHLHGEWFWPHDEIGEFLSAFDGFDVDVVTA